MIIVLRVYLFKNVYFFISKLEWLSIKNIYVFGFATYLLCFGNVTCALFKRFLLYFRLKSMRILHIDISKKWFKYNITQYYPL